MDKIKLRIRSLRVLLMVCCLLLGNIAYADETVVPTGEDQMPSREVDGAYWYNGVWEVNAPYADKTRVAHDRTLPARTFFIPSKTESDALLPLIDWREKENWQSLNGEWDFKLVARPDEVIEDFHLEDFELDDSWITMPVPASWQMHENGIDDQPLYSNWYYPWTQKGYLKIEGEPNIEGEGLDYSAVAKATAPKNYNPVGHYIREFEINPDNADDYVILNFQGVESAFYVYVNGQYVGYSEDSFTQHEFDISQYVYKDKPNKLAVLVYRWSDGSLLENQDLVNYSGIFRDTGLIYRSSKASLFDFSNDITLHDDSAVLTTTYKLSAGAKKATIKLYDAEEELVAEADAILEDGEWTSSLVVYEPELWNPENPYLYKQVMAIYDDNDEITEYVGYEIGLREVSLVQTSNGKTTYALNGVPIVFKGVNRHELDNNYARTVRMETIKKDLDLMKRGNVNAIRMSHYPNCVDIYILANQYGIMIMDEANMETHAAGGLAGIPMSVETFRYPSIHRTANMYERDKNFTSVVAWSNGNECIFFAPPIINDEYAFRLMYNYIKERDSKRPIVLERDNREGIADIRSRMYWPASEHSSPLGALEGMEGNDKEILESDDVRPYLQVEYAHSMGNSLGYYKEYWDLWRKYPHAMGGFIWDWVDQSPLWQIPDDEEATGMSYDEDGEKVAEGGTHYYAYGGDWDRDKNNNFNNFMDNGLISSDRIPHDAYSQMKFVQQNILFSDYDAEDNSVEITNEFGYTNLNEFDFKVSVLENGEFLDLDEDDVSFTVDLDARSSERVDLPELSELFEFDDEKEYYLIVSAQLREDTEWADKGYEIAFAEFKLHTPDNYYQADKSLSNRENEIVETEDSLVVKNERIYFELDKNSFEWTKFAKDGIEFFSEDSGAGMYANFWRPPVDNDRENEWLDRVKPWRESNLNRRRGEIEVDSYQKDKTVVTVNSKLANRSKLKEVYTIYADGHVNYQQSLKPFLLSKEIPAIGTMFELDNAYNQLSYYGRGAATTFVDRWEGYKHGIYEETVDYNALGNYVKPQENGNHVDVRWAKMLNDEGQGLLVKSNDTALEIMASPYNQYDITDTLHPYKLTSTDKIFFRVNYKTQGVGGENSWGARPLAYAEIEPKEYQFNYDIFPVGFAEESGGEEVDFDYLSDLDYLPTSMTTYDEIHKDVEIDGGKLSLYYNGEPKEFDKGISIHANGILEYDLTDKNYKEFSCLVGTDASQNVSGKMKIVFSIDDVDVETVYCKSRQNASEVRLALPEDSKLLTITIYADGVDWNDHATFADAKLSK